MSTDSHRSPMVDRDLFAMVHADRTPDATPDLDRLRRRARRRLARHRARAAGCMAAVAVLVGGPTWLVVRADEHTSDDSVVVDSPTAPTSSAAPTPRWQVPQPGAIRAPDGTSWTGEWEHGRVVGTPITLDRVGTHDRILYAVDWIAEEGDPRPTTSIAVGLRDGDRILRLMAPLVPASATEPDGVALHDGYQSSDAEGWSGRWSLYGAVPGEHVITVTGADSAPRITSSTDVLPGFTVFHATGSWQADWPDLNAAPLTVRTEDGLAVAVRDRTWTG